MVFSKKNVYYAKVKQINFGSDIIITKYIDLNIRIYKFGSSIVHIHVFIPKCAVTLSISFF